MENKAELRHDKPCSNLHEFGLRELRGTIVRK